MYQAFRPGKYWYDTNGSLIQAHGGSVCFFDGMYYWVGENKEGVTGTALGEPCPIWHNGVRLYSSVDLYNWHDEGVILVSSGDPNTPFHPRNIMDRPHILRNKQTGLYVLWAKIGGVLSVNASFSTACMAVATAKKITGPWTIQGLVKPGLPMGDFDLVEDGNKAYIIYECPHTDMICQTLTWDYTNVTSELSHHLYRGRPPFTREAPAFFQAGARKFLITSGTTGYFPNSSETYEIEDFHGQWRLLGQTFVGDKTHTSFHSQVSSVFHVPNTDCYIALGDRWLTDLPVEMPDFTLYYQNRFPQTSDFSMRFPEFAHLSDMNTSMATYVWLPIRFTSEGTPYITWEQEWKCPF